MKKIYLRILFLAVLITVLVLPTQLVSASISKAITIPVNTTQKGTLTDYYDEDFYKFTIPAAGNVKLSIKNKTGSEWDGYIINSKSETFETVSTDDSELVTGYADTEVGLPPGTYYIKIDNSYKAQKVLYEFKLKFTESKFYEKEFNDNITNANLINLNTSYKANINNYYDEDFYKITLPKAGNVTLSFKQKSGAKWYAHIQNGSGEVFDNLYTDSSELVEGQAKVQVGLPKGTYYIQVKNYDDAVDQPYEFKVGFSSSEFYEKESNNSISTANTIKLNKEYSANISDYYDQDFYKIIIPSDGNITLTMNQKAGSAWYGHIQNSKGEVYESWYTDDSELVDGTANIEVGLPKGTYYIQIKNYDYAYDVPYKFKVAFKSSPYYEKEFNDSLTTANIIKMNKTYSGRLSDSSDKDIFKFTTPSNGNVILAIKQTTGASWYGHIQNSSGTVIKYLYTDDSELVKGNATIQTNLKKGTYYFVLNNYDNAYDKPYQFSVSKKSEKLNSSQVKAINNKGKNDTITIKGLSKGEIVKVYNASSKGKLLTSATSKGASVTLSVKQLSAKSGKVYVTVTKADQLESERLAVSYIGEKTDAPQASQVKVKNNKGKNDTIVVNKLKKGDVVKIYNASTKGKLLKSATSKGASVTLSVKQLSAKSGKIYVTVTKADQLESERLAVSYIGEKTDAPQASQVKVKNNKGKNDTIVVNKLKKGDVVKIYNASTKGKLLKSATSKGASVTLTVNQLGKKAGKVYISVTKNGMQESARTTITYTAEK